MLKQFRGYNMVLEGPTVSVGYIVECAARTLGFTSEDPVKRAIGRIIHERVERELKSSSRVFGKIASIEMLYESENLGLRGVPDIVLTDGTPVEIKSGEVPKQGVYFLHQLQVCLYALLLEDVLEWDIDRGYVYCTRTREKKDVKLGEELRIKSLKTLRTAKKLKTQEEVYQV